VCYSSADEERKLAGAALTHSGGWSWGALGASVAVHGAAVATTLGHPSAVVSEVAGPSTVTMELVTAPPDITTPDAPPERVAGSPSPRGHTHTYPVPASHDWTPHDPSLVHVFAATPIEPASSAVTPSENAPPVPEPLPRFTIAIGAVGSAGLGKATAFTGDGRAGEGGAIESERSVSTPARLERAVAPRYPNEARAHGVEADVPLEVVVSATGAVECARSLGDSSDGFDEAALEAIRLYRFAPATRAGHPVRIRMRWTMEFRLR
jgi:TonB family protein